MEEADSEVCKRKRRGAPLGGCPKHEIRDSQKMFSALEIIKGHKMTEEGSSSTITSVETAAIPDKPRAFPDKPPLRMLRLASTQKRLVHRIMLEDGFIWRKHGQKRIRYDPHTRIYYRCAAKPCLAKKSIQRKIGDSYLLISSGTHTCPWVPFASPNLVADASCKEEDKVGTPSERQPRFQIAGASSPLSHIFIVLTLTGIRQGKCTKMGVRVKPLPQESMEFFFFDPQDMAFCVGIGMRQAKVVLDKNLDVSIYELDADNWDLHHQYWTTALLNDDCHLVMSLTQDNMQTEASESEQGLKSAMKPGKTCASTYGVGFDNDFHHQYWTKALLNDDCHLVTSLTPDNMQTEASESEQGLKSAMKPAGKTCASTYGVGFDEDFQLYMNETPDHSEVNWPVLYDIAAFVLTQTSMKECNNESTGKSESSSNEVPSESTMMQALAACGKHKLNIADKDVLEGEENDGDENGEGSRHNDGDCDDGDLPLTLRVIVHPLPKDAVFDTDLNLEVELPYDNLEGASIAPALVFDFRRNRDCKRITIKASTTLEVASEKSILHNYDYFGWYHDEINIKLSNDDVQDARSPRVAMLRNRAKMLNPVTPSKYTLGKTSTSSAINNYSGQGGGSLKLGGVAKLQGTLGGSRSKQLTLGCGQSAEITGDSICGGFFFRNWSRSERPASARFHLFYPWDYYDICRDGSFLMSQGLFSTIEPKLVGTWIPLNDSDASPYMFTIDRMLKLRRRKGELRDKDEVTTYKQSYLLSFYVNHAMTHLRRERGPPLELHGEQQIVPNVLRVAHVC